MLPETRVAHSVTEEEAVRLARELYGIEATARALPGEYDDNFHLTSGDGHAFVLKVMHPAREQSFIDMQSGALQHLAQRAPQLPLPRVIPNRRHELFSSTGAAGGSARLASVVTLLDWKSLAGSRPHTTGRSGRLAG